MQFSYVAFNASRGPLGDPEVRKAISMAIDRGAISQGMYDGHCTPQVQPYLEGTIGYSEKVGSGLDLHPYNPEAAKKILEEHGVEDLDINLVASNVSIYTKLGEVVQDQLKDVGINVSVETVPGAEILQKFALEKSADALPALYSGSTDPDGIVGRYLQPTALYNPGAADYSEMLSYAAEGAASVDPATRTESYEKMVDLWVESPPHILPICMIHNAAGFKDNVSGIVQTVAGNTDLRGVAISKA